jgi:hypothetical protein
MGRRCVLLCLLLLAACASETSGLDVERDIARYYYRNRPRDLPANAAYERKPQLDKPVQSLDERVIEFSAGSGGATIASSDIPWQIPRRCLAQYRQAMGGIHRAPVLPQRAWLEAGNCRDVNGQPLPAKTSFVGIGISGGGNKSAVYATEVMFELQRYGLLEDVDVVSSVSGGSFPAVLYALSCSSDAECASLKTPEGFTRPRWLSGPTGAPNDAAFRDSYIDIRDRIHSNYFWPFFGRRFLPHHLYLNAVTKHGSSDDMMDVVSSRFLRDFDIEKQLTFAHLNPSRPNLILNATNSSRDRRDFEEQSDIPDIYKRRLTDDAFLHFSFTQQYFWRLLSDLDAYPLAEGVVASAAFPLIIDRPTLRHFRVDDLAGRLPEPDSPREYPRYVALYDGGVHDNFGLTEIQWELECLFNRPMVGFRILPSSSAQMRSGLVQQRFGASRYTPGLYRRNCQRELLKDAPKPDSVLVMSINSSLLRSMGVDSHHAKPRSWDSYVLPVRISGTAESVDMIMMAAGELRKDIIRRLIRDIGEEEKADGTPRRSFYVDFDIEALKFGSFACDADVPELVLLSSGMTWRSRCEAFKTVMQWEQQRNLLLPRASASFCAGDRVQCQPFHDRFGETPPERRGAPTILDEENDAWLVSNEHIFAKVADVPTDFQLEDRYAWLLRYAARWIVARRVAEICMEAPDVFDAIGKRRQVCEAALPNRPVRDDVGETDFAR